MVPDTNSISINELPGVATSHNNVEYCFNYSKFNHVVLQIKLVKFPLKFQLSYLHTKRLVTVFNFVSLLMILRDLASRLRPTPNGKRQAAACRKSKKIILF